MLRLSPGAGSKRAQVEEQLRDAVRSGRLAQGLALPSTRALARDLGVSRGVVVDAYAQLAAEGYLIARQGAPTRVSDAAAPPPAETPRDEAPRAPRFDFRPGGPDVSLFPRAVWLASLRRALSSAPDARLDYGDPRGAPELRHALARYLGRVRGVAADPERVIVTSGMAQGMAVFARALVALGARRMAMEDPSSAPGRAQLAANGLDIVGVPVDADGLRVNALEQRAASGALDASWSLRRTSSRSVWCSAPERRATLIDWAGASGALVLEDDYDAEYRYDRDAGRGAAGPRPRAGGVRRSVSKTLAPGLRLGWLVVPERVAEAAGAAKASDDLGTPVVEQLALADFLERGEFDRHLRRTRSVYRARRDALVSALERHLPACAPTGVAAGLHLVVPLPPGSDEQAVLEAARSSGLDLQGLSEHRIAPGPPALLLGYGRISEPAIETRGVARCADGCGA